MLTFVSKDSSVTLFNYFSTNNCKKLVGLTLVIDQVKIDDGWRSTGKVSWVALIWTERIRNRTIRQSQSTAVIFTKCI